MPSNVEIKAKIDDGKTETIFEEACKVATAENGSPATVTLLEQSDTFFHCVQPGQRLKLRQQVRDGVVEKAQLIVYSRPDQTGPKFCEYSIVFLDKSEAEQLKVPTFLLLNKHHFKTIILDGSFKIIGNRW